MQIRFGESSTYTAYRHTILGQSRTHECFQSFKNKHINHCIGCLEMMLVCFRQHLPFVFCYVLCFLHELLLQPEKYCQSFLPLGVFYPGFAEVWTLVGCPVVRGRCLSPLESDIAGVQSGDWFSFWRTST